MVIPDSWRRARRLFRMALLLAVLPALLLTRGPAFAVTSGCRTAPVIILSNGAIFDMRATIGTSLPNVQHVTYTLHAPQGTWVMAAISTPNWPTTTESFAFFADAAPGEYTTDTIVYTANTNVSVQAT